MHAPGQRWADFNRDGFLDLFVSNWGNVASGDDFNYFYLNNGNSNALPRIAASDASQIVAPSVRRCAKAVIHGREVVQLREVSGGGFYVSQNALDPLFGLADATNVSWIAWNGPSGIVQELLNFAASVHRHHRTAAIESFGRRSE